MMNEERVRRRLITIGGSAGSVHVLREIAMKLPHDLGAAVAAVTLLSEDDIL